MDAHELFKQLTCGATFKRVVNKKTLFLILFQSVYNLFSINCSQNKTHQNPKTTLILK